MQAEPKAPKTISLLATVSALGFALGVVLVTPAFAAPEPEPKPPKPKEGLMAGDESQASLASTTAVDSQGRAAMGGGPHVKSKLKGSKAALAGADEKSTAKADEKSVLGGGGIGEKGVVKHPGGANQVKWAAPPPSVPK